MILAQLCEIKGRAVLNAVRKKDGIMIEPSLTERSVELASQETINLLQKLLTQLKEYTDLSVENRISSSMKVQVAGVVSNPHKDEISGKLNSLAVIL